MDIQTIAYFVNTYITRNRRERLLHELTTPKKYYDGISRFCHRSDELLDPAKIAVKSEKPDQLPAFIQFVRTHDEPCRMLSPDPGLDGQLLPLASAVEQAAAGTDAVLIVGRGFAVVFEEAGKNGRSRYLLTEANHL